MIWESAGTKRQRLPSPQSPFASLQPVKYLSGTSSARRRSLRRLPFVWTACRFVAATSGEGGRVEGGCSRGWVGGCWDPTPRVATNTRGLSAAKVEHGSERQPVASAAQWGNWDSVSRRRRWRRWGRWGRGGDSGSSGSGSDGGCSGTQLHVFAQAAGVKL